MSEKCVGKVCRKSVSGKCVGKVCRKSVSEKHVERIALDDRMNNQGLGPGAD